MIKADKEVPVLPGAVAAELLLGVVAPPNVQTTLRLATQPAFDESIFPLTPTLP